MVSIWSKTLYKYFGPTTVHLQNEFGLLLIMCLFTIASFCTMYHSNEYFLLWSATDSGDRGYDGCHWKEIAYIILSTAWLGRHLMHRIICTTEANTSTYGHGRIGVSPQQLPPILSSMYKIWIWICFGGQYFDIPSCPIQFTLHTGPSPTLNSLTYSATSTSNLGGTKSKFNSTFRSIFQNANMKSPMVGVVDHHRSMNKSNSDNFINRKTPPLHRTVILQVLFIVPMIVVPISITKYIMSSLRSRKRSTRGYYDSDDDDEDTDYRRRSRRGDHSSNQWDDIDNTKNSDSDAFDSEDENAYINIHVKTQNQVNSHLDVVWMYVPPVQFVLFFFILSTFAFVGLQFHTSSTNALTGSGNALKGNKRFGYENYAKYNNPGMNQGFQPYAQNLYPGGPSSSASNFGSQSTILNAELMAQRFEMKQREKGNDIGGKNPIHHSIGLHLNKLFQYAAKFHLNSWKSIYYSPWGMIYMMSLWGVVASLLLFGRLVLPIPDLTTRGRESWVGKGANQKSHKQKRREKSWAERYMPISSGNKFNLYFKVITVRIIEYVIVCAIIPQSSFMCKATGYCNIEPTIFEIGDPTLILSRSRAHVRSMYENLIYDDLVAKLITFSVIITSALMLIGQLLVLDRSSLSLEAHHYVQGASNNGTMRASDSSHRRGGKKHNSNGIVWNSENSNSSSINNHSGVVKKRSLVADIKSAIYECFSLEIGALSTSQTLCYIFYAHALHALVVVLISIFYCSTGRDWYPLVLALFAIFTAAGGSDLDTAHFDELDDIAREINAYYEK